MLSSDQRFRPVLICGHSPLINPAIAATNTNLNIVPKSSLCSTLLNSAKCWSPFSVSNNQWTNTRPCLWSNPSTRICWQSEPLWTLVISGFALYIWHCLLKDRCYDSIKTNPCLSGRIVERLHVFSLPVIKRTTLLTISNIPWSVTFMSIVHIRLTLNFI
mgnify:CR=1 FL=1